MTPSYYRQLAASVGLTSTTLRALVEEVFQEPTDERWRILGVILAVAYFDCVEGSPAQEGCHDLIVIVGHERELAHHGHLAAEG